MKYTKMKYTKKNKKFYKKSYKKSNKNIKNDIKYYTYIIKSEILNENLIKKIMEKRGNWKPFYKNINKNKNNLNPNFLYTDFTTTHENKDLFKLRVGIKNIIGDEKKKISQKENLSNTLKDTLKKHPNKILENCLIENYNF